MMPDEFADYYGIGRNQKEEPGTVFNPETSKRPGPSTLTFTSVLEVSVLVLVMFMHWGQEPR